MGDLAEWQDHIVEYPERYQMTQIDDDFVEMKRAPGTIKQQGTPINAENVNAIINALNKVINDFEDYKNGALDREHPVGSLYISEDDTNPADLFGGTWTQITGRFLLAASSDYAVGSTGGSKTVTLTTNQIPSHRHDIVRSLTGGSQSVTQTSWKFIGGDNNDSSQATSTTAALAGTLNTGDGEAHNNMPPYRAVYMWRRTA